MARYSEVDSNNPECKKLRECPKAHGLSTLIDPEIRYLDGKGASLRIPRACCFMVEEHIPLAELLTELSFPL